jgi:hypothetical protein
MIISKHDIPKELLDLGFRYEEGWLGAFTRNQADGAIPNGATVFKTHFNKGDTHKPGDKARVLGSLPVPKDMKALANKAKYFYFVEWEDSPRMACSIVGDRIAPV